MATAVASGVGNPAEILQTVEEEQKRGRKQDKPESSSTVSLIEALGLAVEDERSLHSLLKCFHRELTVALQELTAITTYDDNLEKQYKEVILENTRLHAELEKAKNEIRHLKGKLSIVQMTPAEIREEKARVLMRDKKRLEQERVIDSQRDQGQLLDNNIQVLTAAERAQTVNARGEYVDHRSRHTRSSTCPAPVPLSLSSPQTSPRRGGMATGTLPPPLVGCGCSECNSRQTLGALTLGKGLCQKHLTNQITKSGQQILLGDKVVVKGEKIGTVVYIGKLDFDIMGQIYIGVHLDMPVGTCDGSLKGRRYFQCPPQHGVFIKPADIICVTGRRPIANVSLMPRVRERLPPNLHMKWSKGPSAGGTAGGGLSFASAATSSTPSSGISRARKNLDKELAELKIKRKTPYDLVDDSVAEMSKRIDALSQKKRSLDSPDTPTTTPTDEPDGSVSLASARPLPPISESEPTPPPELIPPPAAAPAPAPRATTPTAARVATPMETKLKAQLEDTDLGSTGFLTASELRTVLINMEKLTPETVEELMAQLGVDTDDGVGVDYLSLLPHLAAALSN